MGLPPPASFSDVTSTKVRISPKFIELEPKVPFKNIAFFLSNTYKIEIKINSLMKMLDLPNFDHMTTSTI